MKIITKELYEYQDLIKPENSKILGKIVSNWELEDFWYSERLKSFEEVKKYVYDSLYDIQEEISGGRLVAWIQNNLSIYWTDANRISKHEDGKIKNSYFAYKYDKCLKFRVSKVFKTNNLENCPFTGVCYDFDFLKPIIEFMKKPKKDTTNLDLVTWMPDYSEILERDYEYQTSEECILETIQANDYTFNESGEIEY